ncbi:MAG: hypothetical protein C0200_03540 [Thermoproteota archaeon]|nr:MAG: hypothetical protein C0200_03540 [Candidatus Korarchaeota archaeon]
MNAFLGLGEAETIVLALELGEAELIILDDLKARNLFKKLKVGKKLIGTIGILKFMLARGIIRESVDDLIRKLEGIGFRFKASLFQDC